MEKHSSTLHYSLNYKQRSCLIGHCLSQRESSLLMVEVNNSLKPEKKLLYEGQTCRGVIGKGKWFRNGDWKDIMILWSDFSLSPLDHGMAFWSSHKTAKERKLSAEELMLNCGVGEDSWESLGLQGDPTSLFWRRSVLGFLLKDWC